MTTTRFFALCLALLAGALVPSTAQAAFPGANGPIVFEDVRNECCLFTIGAGGGAPSYIAGTTASIDPAISPDGRSVAFSYNRNIVIAGLDGSGRREVTSGGNNDQGVAWSPDGTQLVFTRADADDLFVVGTDGSGLRNLTGDGGNGQEYEPAWSPDGSTIAYERGTSAGQGSIYTIPAGGGGATNITPEQPTPPTCDPDFFTHSSEPSWSPDGSRIAFTGPSLCPGGGPKNYGDDIWVMAPNGSGKTNITNNDGPSENEPHWSPDGTQIAFTSDAEEIEGNSDLMVMDAGGGGMRKVVDREIKGEDIDWGPAPAARVVPTRLTAKAKGLSRRRVRVTGKLVLPGGAACAGRVKVTVRKGSRRLGSKTAKVTAGCRYKAVVRVKRSRGTGTVLAAFRGTSAIAPKKARKTRVRLR